MISNQARAGFDHFLIQAVKGSFVSSPDQHCELSVIADLTEIHETKVVVLTLASYLFRVTVLIYFTPDQMAKEHIGILSAIDVSDISEKFLYDAIAECGNICCGILSRELSAFFPHIGMSTPNILDKASSAFLGALGCGHVQHFRVDVDDRKPFHVGLCVREYADLHFVVDLTETVDSTGELEMF